MEVRKIRQQDIDQIVLVHNSSFPDFFLTSLGSNFLKVYYKSLIKDSEGIGVCVCASEDIVGFSVGCIRSAGFNKRLIRTNLLLFFIEFFKIVFTRPTALLRLVKNLDKKDHSNKDNGDYAELLSIAVLPEFKSKGIGKILLSHFETEVYLKKENTNISLTTDAFDNDAVLSFYKQNGYIFLYEFISYPNRKMYRLIKLYSSLNLGESFT
ncbi:MAG: N-acetyltransferase [Bacteroidales bacterium]